PKFLCPNTAHLPKLYQTTLLETEEVAKRRRPITTLCSSLEWQQLSILSPNVVLTNHWQPTARSQPDPQLVRSFRQAQHTDPKGVHHLQRRQSQPLVEKPRPVNRFRLCLQVLAKPDSHSTLATQTAPAQTPLVLRRRLR